MPLKLGLEIRYIFNGETYQKVQRKQRGNGEVGVTALARKMGFSPPVVTILAKRLEKITRENEFELYGKWFSMILRCPLCSLTHKPIVCYSHPIRKRALITFTFTNGAMLVLRQAGDGGLALPQEPTTIHLPFANLLPFEGTCPPSFVSNHTGIWPLSVSEPHVWGGAG